MVTTSLHPTKQPNKEQEMADTGCPYILSWFLLFYLCLSIFFLQRSFPPHHHLLQRYTINFPPKLMMNVDPRIGRGITININHCSTVIGHRGQASIMKNMLEAYFPGVKVILDIHPPDLQNRVLIRVIRLGGFAIIVVGEHLFRRMGVPRHWFIALLIRSHSIWELERVTVKLLEETNAFEVYFNGELIFSKLKEGRFPTEFELRELVARKLVDSTVPDGLGAGVLWS